MSWAAEIEQSLSSDTLVRGKTLGELFECYRDEILIEDGKATVEYIDAKMLSLIEEFL
ncbi:MAG: hypothetical protein GXP08_11410 [Gammaproteobacteria bacterium]|nr:hypothetical protein [Gammaproteobacteria bacterium]